MTGAQTDVCVSTAAGMESQLASALSATSQQVSRLDTLDQEQRAEIYAILKAIHEDTVIHREMADSLAKLAAS